MKRFVFLLSIAFAIPLSITAQTITTITGGTIGYTGDGGPASAASLRYPSGVVVDPFGNILFTDVQNNCVREITTGGIIKTIAGNGVAGYSGDGGQATAAQLNQPIGIALDRSGNIYIADNGNNRIRKVSPSGIITLVAGKGTYAFSGDGGLATAASLKDARNLAISTSGEIYITEYSGHRVRKVSTSGYISTVAGTGFGGFSGDGGPASAAQLNNPTGITIDRFGNLFVCNAGHPDIRKITPSGTITTIAGTGTPFFGGDGGPAIDADLDVPIGITVDTLGNIYFSDSYNNRLRVITPLNTIYTIAGDGTYGFAGDGGPASAAEFSSARGVAVDQIGNLYVADYLNNRVRRISRVLALLGLNPAVNSGGLIIQESQRSMAFRMLVEDATVGNTAVMIADISGRVLKKFTIATNKVEEIYLSSAPGLYIVSAITSAGKVSRKVFLK